ncbi:MAG TPA: hypothetical protein VM555_09680 [Tahibacter sp.]|nr:hypothetical protein [Tahibacter sp.]
MATFPRIDRVCPQHWNALPDAGGVDCAPCGKRVHNLNALSDTERADFLARSEGPVCVAYVVNRRTPPAVATWLLAAAVGTFAGAASAEATLPPMPISTAIAGAVDGDKGDTLLEPILMVGAVIDPTQAQTVDDGTDAAPALPVIVDDDTQ